MDLSKKIITKIDIKGKNLVKGVNLYEKIYENLLTLFVFIFYLYFQYGFDISVNESNCC